MSRPTTPNLAVCRIDKNAIGENSLYDLFAIDSDFTENEEYFRDDTLTKGFKDEAERVSSEIYNKHKDTDVSELERVYNMLDDVFDVDNFIGTSDHYGKYEYQVVDTEFEYVIVVAYTT